MAYSQIDLQTSDFDIFLFDLKKAVHLASGGGNLPTPLYETDRHNESVSAALNNFEGEFDIEINPTELSAGSDLSSFIAFAKKGFYTYDKTFPGNFEDTTFHLVAKPKQPFTNQYIFEKYSIERSILSTKTIIPENFEPFNLKDFL